MNVKRRIAVFHASGIKRLPFSVVKVEKDAEGNRVVDGVRSFVDSFPGIPWGERDCRGNYRLYSKGEREYLFLKATRAAKRASKLGNEKPAKEVEPGISFSEAMDHIARSQIGTKEAKSFPDMPKEFHTVKRNGKWCRVGSDDLTAHIEAR